MKGTRQETVIATALELVNYHKGRTSLAIHNLGSATVYHGTDNQVSLTNGFPIRSGQSIAFSEITGDDPKIARWFIGSGSDIIAIGEEYLKKKVVEE